MNRQDLFAAIRPFAPGQSFTNGMVQTIDALADAFGLDRLDPAPKRTSTRGRALIKGAEGTELKAYRDTGGVWTIGTGHTGPDVTPGLTITAERADELLQQDLRTAEAAVNRLFPTTTQDQFDALVSFTFNLGEGQVSASTLRKLHNAGDYAGAAGQFSRWVFDNGVKLNGLVTRRAAEAKLYRGEA